MSWSTYLDDNQARFVEELLDFVRIPSVSASTAHVADVVAAGRKFPGNFVSLLLLVYWSWCRNHVPL